MQEKLAFMVLSILVEKRVLNLDEVAQILGDAAESCARHNQPADHALYAKAKDELLAAFATH